MVESIEVDRARAWSANADPTPPGGRSPDDNVRRLQDRLRDVAKQQPGRKFHALYARISRSDVLEEAWNLVRRNKAPRVSMPRLSRRSNSAA